VNLRQHVVTPADVQEPATIAIVALNARFSHCSLAARSLLANLRLPKALLLEFDLKQPPEHVAEIIAAQHPRIVAMGVYIWNRAIVEQLMPLLREKLPGTRIILGGPEISFDTVSILAAEADCVICGEAERQLSQTCSDMLAGLPVPHVIHPPPPDLAKLHIPTAEYTDADLAHRNIYMETSRGCPYACRFCLSSLCQGIRYYPLPAVFASLDALCARGARSFRFVDRSFNLAGRRSIEILAYFLHKNIDDLFLHLEIVPECLSPKLRATMLQFPPGCLHVETGIQSLNPEVLRRVNRPIHPEAALEGIHWLTHAAKATVHVDLIAGLPGESLLSFIEGFHKLHRQAPAEIQLGILKHLPGTDLDQEPGMQFHPHPPYEVIQSDAMSPSDLDQVRRLAAHWERIINRNHFPATSQLLMQGPNVWQTFDAFSRSLEQQHGRHGIGLVESARILHQFLNARQAASPEAIRAALEQDYLSNGRRTNLPAFLRKRT